MRAWPAERVAEAAGGRVVRAADAGPLRAEFDSRAVGPGDGQAQAVVEVGLLAYQVDASGGPPHPSPGHRGPTHESLREET